MKKLLCIYHKIDFDGLCSYAIVRRWARANGYIVDSIGYTHGDSLPFIDDIYDTVFVVDVCLTAELMEDLARQGRLVWIDHHSTTIEESVTEGFSGVKGVRREGVGACELCWEYLFPGLVTPKLVKYLSAYDVWDKDRFDWEGEILPFQYGLRNRADLNFPVFNSFFLKACRGVEQTRRIIEEGRVIINYARTTGKRACEAYSFVIEIAGQVKGLCMLTSHFGALEMEQSMLEKGCQVAVCVNHHNKYDHYKVSVYGGTSILPINLGQYMKDNYRGGGHRNAAGGKLTDEQFQRLMKEKIF